MALPLWEGLSHVASHVEKGKLCLLLFISGGRRTASDVTTRGLSRVELG